MRSSSVGSLALGRIGGCGFLSGTGGFFVGNDNRSPGWSPGWSPGCLFLFLMSRIQTYIIRFLGDIYIFYKDLDIFIYLFSYLNRKSGVKPVEEDILPDLIVLQILTNRLGLLLN